MSESDSDEFLSAEEDSLLPTSNALPPADRLSEQLETPVDSSCEGGNTHTNIGDIVDAVIERDDTQVTPPTADNSADTLDITSESCQRDDQTLVESTGESLSSTQTEKELNTTEEPASEDIQPLDPIQLEAVRTEALAMKETGNSFYRGQDYSSARDSYSSALELCPRELSVERAVLFSNRSLCLLKLEEHQLALSDCTEALLIDPQFKKAKVRRAQLYERTDKLEEALSDYTELLTADPSCPQAREAVPRLTVAVEAQREALKTEAISKLKDLGDMVLKPFGISTSDFNFIQDPNTGSYSVSFGKNS